MARKKKVRKIFVLDTSVILHDHNSIKCFAEHDVAIPITVLGGAGSLQDIGQMINKYGIIGVAAGSLFVFKGKYKAVLINYPNSIEKESLIKKYYNYMIISSPHRMSTLFGFLLLNLHLHQFHSNQMRE